MPSVKPVIFISYSHRDSKELEFVQGHLQVGAENEYFETWDDRRIRGGADWKKEIDDALTRCAAFILLVSRHSLTSNFILRKEVQDALQAHWDCGLSIYPIVLSPCDVQAASWLMSMNLRPRDGKALSEFKRPDRDKVMALLAAEIRQIVATVKDTKSPRTVETLVSSVISPSQLEGAYGDFLDPVREILKGDGVDPAKRRAIRDVLLEYLVNLDTLKSEPETDSHIEVRKEDKAITVELQRSASETDAEQMRKLVEEYK